MEKQTSAKTDGARSNFVGQQTSAFVDVGFSAPRSFRSSALPVPLSRLELTRNESIPDARKSRHVSVTGSTLFLPTRASGSDESRNGASARCCSEPENSRSPALP